ncbi:hypothetical protein B0F90DRAFT_578875 [Multifurca ochricompacta]|uniref:Uncharacterized protein n=1 Tax=Multifurca ochricompacta TaxID=376703 RepID=A0AAD4QHB3_9AGAM|nr:hypothetical protein B0F90DRAFT_578875 [Multifurca ochricompacta]
MLLGEVGKLREERRNIQFEIGTLLCLRSKYETGGMFTQIGNRLLALLRHRHQLIYRLRSPLRWLPKPLAPALGALFTSGVVSGAPARNPKPGQ